jgi:hypothetical protein
MRLIVYLVLDWSVNVFPFGKVSYYLGAVYQCAKDSTGQQAIGYPTIALAYQNASL